MTTEQLRKEQDKLIESMNEWLEAFNKFADRLIEKPKETEKLLREIKNG